MPRADLSIVVVTRAPSLLLARLFRTLARARAVERTEILVGVASEAGVEPARRLAASVPAARVEIVQVPKVSPAAARNLVVPRAASPLLLFLDDDAEVPPDLLANAIELMRDESIVAAGGPVLTPPKSTEFERLVGRVLGSPIATGPVRHRYRLGSSARTGTEHNLLMNAVVRREAYAEGLDGDLKCAEEIDFYARLRRSGGRLVHRPELAFYHYHRSTLRAHLRQMLKYGFGRGQVMVRAPSLDQLPYGAPSTALAAWVALTAVRPPWGLAAAGAYLAVLALAAAILGSVRRAGTAFALLLGTHLCYALGVAGGVAYETADLVVPRRSEAGRPRLASDSARTFVALAVSTTLAVAGGVLVARVLGPGGRGLFELGRTLSFGIGLPAGIGAGGAAVFMRARGEIDRPHLFGSAAVAFASAALVALGLAAVLAAGGGWHDLTGTEIFLVCVSVPLIAFYLEGQSALRGIAHGAAFRRAVVGFDLLFLVIAGAALAASRSLTASLAAWAIAWLVGALWVALLLLRSCGRPEVPSTSLRRLLVFGLPLALLALLTQANMRVDVIVLQALEGPSEVGQYAVAFGAAALIIYGGMAIGLMLFPRTAERTGGDPAGGSATTAVAVRSTLALALAAAALLAVAGPYAVELLMGGDFSPAGTPLRVLVPGAVAAAVVMVLQNDLSARGRFWLVAAISAAAVALHVGLALALVPPLGASGAALASTITYLAAGAVVVGVFVRSTETPLLECLNVLSPAARETFTSFARSRRSQPAAAPLPSAEGAGAALTDSARSASKGLKTAATTTSESTTR